VELNALIDARNNDKISEADRFTISAGNFSLNFLNCFDRKQEFVQLIAA